MTSGDDDIGPWLAILTTIGVILWGSLEMRFSKRTNTGLAIWTFAIAPYSAAIYLVAAWRNMGWPWKAIIILGMVVAPLIVLSKTYEHVVSKGKDDKR